MTDVYKYGLYITYMPMSLQRHTLTLSNPFYCFTSLSSPFFLFPRFLLEKKNKVSSLSRCRNSSTFFPFFTIIPFHQLHLPLPFSLTASLHQQHTKTTSNNTKKKQLPLSASSYFHLYSHFQQTIASFPLPARSHMSSTF